MDHNIDDLMYGGDGDVVEDTFGDEIDSTRPFPDGEFTIKSIKDKSLCLDLVENVSGAIIHCHQYNAGDNQTWVLDYDDDKEGYKIESKQNPDLLLSLNSNDTSKEVNLREYTESSGNNQYWRIEETEDGYFRLRNLEKLDLIITMQNKSSSFGGKEVIVDIENSASDKENYQKWIISFVSQQSISDGDYHIVNRNLSDIVVEFKNEGDSLVYGHSYLGNDNQEWKFSYDREKEAYKVKSVLNPQLLLTWNSNDTTKKMILRAYTESGSKNQYWRLERTDDGSFKLRNLEDLTKILMLSDLTDSSDGGLNLIVHEDSGDNTNLYPKWTIKRVSHQSISDGDYHISNRTLPDIVVEFTNQEDSLVHGHSYLGKDNQKWSIIYDEDKKAYKIKSGAKSDLLLSWNSNAASKEMFLRAFTESGSKNQYWRIEHTNDGSYKLRNLENPGMLLALIDKNSAHGGKVFIVSDTKESAKDSISINWYLKKIGKANIVPDGKFKIATKLSSKKVIDTNQESILVIIDNENLVTSEWQMKFDSTKNAYKIISSKNSNLGWVYQNKNCSVKVDNVGDSSNLGNYWTIEYNIQKGSYLIRSLSQPSQAVSYSDDNLLITGTASYSDNQLFHFIRN